MEVDFKAFERSYAYTVFKDKNVLSPLHFPAELIGRDNESFKLAKLLFVGTKDGGLVPMVRVFGRPGSGKTVVVRKVLEDFREYKGEIFRYFYVNVKHCRTVLSAGNAVLATVCGRKVAANLGLDQVFSELWVAVETLKKKGVLFFVFVFDEADSIFFDKHFDGSDFFYRFLRASTTVPELSEVKICVITITNDLRALNNLDARVKSSMGGEFIFFASYSQECLKAILKARVNDAFEPNRVPDEVLDYCAQIAAEAGGDARKAIELLKIGGENTYAPYGGVTKASIRLANKDVKNSEVIEVLNSLTREEELVVFALVTYSINTQKTITTSEFYRYYSMMNFGEELKRVGQRRVLQIINDLERYGIVVTRNVSKGRGGYKKEIGFTIDPQIIKDHVEGSIGYIINGLGFEI